MGRTENINQAVADFNAYVDTLDLGETLGEILHMSRFHNHVMAHSPMPGTADRLAAVALGALGERVDHLLAETAAVPPPHDGSVHSCTLLMRMLNAALRGDL